MSSLLIVVAVVVVAVTVVVVVVFNKQPLFAKFEQFIFSRMLNTI